MEKKQLPEAIFSSLPGIFSLVDHAGKILRWNRNLEIISGYSPDEIPRMSALDFFAGEDRVSIRQKMQEVFERGAAVGEATLVSKDGKRTPYHFTGQKVEVDGRPCIVGMGIDITERKRVEEALRQLATRHETILSEIPDIVMEVDVNKIYTWANPAGYEFFGHDVIGKEAASYFEGEQDAYAKMQPMFDGDTSLFHVESWQRRRDGQPRLLAWWCRALKNAEGRITGALSTARDITEMRHAEEALARQTRQLEAIRGITTEITRELDLTALLDLIIRRAIDLLGANSGTVRLWDEQTELLILAAWHGLGDWAKDQSRRLGEGVAGTVAQRHEGMIVNDYPRSPYANPAILERVQINAMLAEPLMYRDRLLGALMVDKHGPGGSFAEGEQRVLHLFATHAAIAIGNARLFEQVRAGRERLRALSRRLVEVQETERRSLARELHDEIGQLLTGLKLLLEMSAGLRVEKVKARLREAQALANELILRVREMSLDLRPAMLDDLGLLPALLWLFERYTSQTEVRVDFQHWGVERRFPSEIETATYRIVQEALNNVARHARVTKATVCLSADEDTLDLRIEDHGAGFDAESVLSGAASSGLAGMRERAALLDGRLSVASVPGGGTRVVAELPLADSVERRRKPR